MADPARPPGAVAGALTNACAASTVADIPLPVASFATLAERTVQWQAATYTLFSFPICASRDFSACQRVCSLCTNEGTSVNRFWAGAESRTYGKLGDADGA